MKLPAKGRSAPAILDELDAMQADDVDWKSGRAFSLAYYPGADAYALGSEACARFQSSNALNTAVIGGVDVVISVGGVGVRARDVAPEATEPLLDRRLPGIEEAVRSSGLAAGATDAGLSRGLAGISGQTLVVNLADSRSAVRDGMATVTMLAHQVIADITEF